MSDRPDRMDQETTKSAGAYLFRLPKQDHKIEDSNGLDMRTRVRSDKMMRLLLYYGFMGEKFGSKTATQIKDRLERLLISHDGLGRDEAVNVLKQNFPKRVEIERGHDGSI